MCIKLSCLALKICVSKPLACSTTTPDPSYLCPLQSSIDKVKSCSDSRHMKELHIKAFRKVKAY